MTPTRGRGSRRRPGAADGSEVETGPSLPDAAPNDGGDAGDAGSVLAGLAADRELVQSLRDITEGRGGRNAMARVQAARLRLAYAHGLPGRGGASGRPTAYVIEAPTEPSAGAGDRGASVVDDPIRPAKPNAPTR